MILEKTVRIINVIGLFFVGFSGSDDLIIKLTKTMDNDDKKCR